LGLFVPAWVSVSVDPVRAFFPLFYCRRARQRMIYHLGISIADVAGRIRGCVVPDSSWVGSHVFKPFGVPGTYQKHVVFTVLRRCGASQGLPLASFWFPARSWPGMHCFPSYLDGFRGVRAVLTFWFSQSWGVVRAPRGSLETLLSIPGSFLPGSWAFSPIFTRSPWGPGPPGMA
jgi:hypothetical protein